MKNRMLLFYLLFFLLTALTLLFSDTPKGEEFMANYFPSVNLREEELIPPPTPAPTPAPSPTPAPVPLTAFYTGIGEELPGYYDLVSLRTEGDEFSDEMLTRLHQLGMPMILELREDGSGVLGIFDQAIALTLDTEKMLAFSEGKTLPFFYLDGRLRVQDGTQFMIFERRF